MMSISSLFTRPKQYIIAPSCKAWGHHIKILITEDKLQKINRSYLCRNIHNWIVHKYLFASFGCKIHICNSEAILLWTAQKKESFLEDGEKKRTTYYTVGFQNDFTLMHSNIQKEDRNLVTPVSLGQWN